MRLAFPPFRLDLVEERLWKGGKQVTLRRKPFAILRYLVTHPRRLVTHDELLAQVWGGAVVSDSAVRSHVHELRQALGEGVIETVIGRGYRFTAPLIEDHPTEPLSNAPAAAPERMIVGRAAELDTLRTALARAATGHRQLCFVTGEPGIGKTTLVDQFLDELDGRDDVLAVRGACVEQHGSPEPYLPVIGMLGQLRQSPRGELALAALVKYAPTFLSQLPHLIPDDKLDEVTRRARGGSETRLVRELIEALESIAAQHTIVAVLEDLQWTDVATVDLLSLLGQRRERARLLVIATSRRAEAQTTTHPLQRVMRTLVARAGALALPLDPIADADVARFIDLRFPQHQLPRQFAEIVARITGGTPLYVVTLLDDLAGRGMIVAREEGWGLSVSLDDVAAHRPDSFKQLVDIQLDRLTVDEQRLLEAASVIGSEFSTALVAAALDVSVEEADDLCDSLVRRSLFLRRHGTEEWPGGELHTRYAMQHGLVQEVCLDRCAPARHQRWHRQIAARLEAEYADRLHDVSYLLATHFDRGGVPARAIPYYLLAVERDERRFASADAHAKCERALELVAALPEDATRDALELQILGRMSQVSVRIKAQPPDPLAMFERMVDLARGLGDAPRLAAALINLSYRHSTLAGYRRAADLVAEFEDLAHRHPLPPGLITFGRTARMVTVFHRGDLAPAEALLEELVAAVVQSDPSHPGILGPTDRVTVLMTYLGFVRLLRGAPDAAVEIARTSVDRAFAAGDPYAIGGACCNLGRIHVLRGDPPADVRAIAQRILALPGGEVWHAQAASLVAWADARDGTLAPDDLARVIRDFRAWTARFRLGTTIAALVVVELLRAVGGEGEAAAFVDEMLAFAEAHDERILEADYLRLRGELVEATDPAAAAAAYTAALELARARGARLSELRAAHRLVALWPDGPRREEGRAALAMALSQITGGAPLPEAVAARALLAID